VTGSRLSLSRGVRGERPEAPPSLRTMAHSYGMSHSNQLNRVTKFLLLVFLFGFGPGFSFFFSSGLRFRPANFSKERLGCGWSRHLA
jgi:hypothetical protein